MYNNSEFDIQWVGEFLSQIVPRRKDKLVIRDPLYKDESRWFRAAVENNIVKFQNCDSKCPRFKKRKESGPDEFILISGRGGFRHLFSLSKPASLNRGYLPHIAAYARIILDLGYDQRQSSFSLYRKFSRDLLSKKKGGWYETDAGFYDTEGNLYLHVEAKKTPKETDNLVQGLGKGGYLTDLSKKCVKELEYVLDLRPRYLWIVGPDSVDREKYVYSVTVDELDARFKRCKHLPRAPGD